MRFKTLRGQMLVIPPDGDPPEWKAVKILYDSSDDSLGIQLIGESQLKGYIFKVLRSDFRTAMESGQVTDKIEAV